MDPLPETRTRFKNNGPAASRRRFWTRGDGSDGPSRIERSIHSTGIVVPLPTHYRKDAHGACRDEFRKYRQIRRRFGAANGKAGCGVVHPSERLQLQHRNCSFPEIAAVEIVCSRASTFRMRPMMLKPHCWTVPARFRRASKTCRRVRWFLMLKDWSGYSGHIRKLHPILMQPFARRADSAASPFSITARKPTGFPIFRRPFFRLRLKFWKLWSVGAYARWARLRNCRPWTFRLGLDRKVSNCTNELGVWVRVRLSRTWIGCGSSTSWNWITKL